MVISNSTVKFIHKENNKVKMMAKDSSVPHLWSEFMHFPDFAPWIYL